MRARLRETTASEYPIALDMPSVSHHITEETARRLAEELSKAVLGLSPDVREPLVLKTYRFEDLGTRYRIDRKVMAFWSGKDSALHFGPFRPEPPALQESHVADGER